MVKQERLSKPRINLIDKKFGRLTPQYYLKGSKWHCICDCGKEIDVSTRNLNSGHTQSCGCLQKEKAAQNTIDMTGYEDDNFKVLRKSSSSPQGTAYWECVCKHCGNIFITKGSNLRTQAISSCGCMRSKGEQKIIQLLMDNNCKFVTQYTFPDLIGAGGRKLRFDFAILLNGQVSRLIEFNGLQHYERPPGKWGMEWDRLIENDKRKREYCKDHNLKLVVIKYNQVFGIKDLLEPVETIS